MKSLFVYLLILLFFLNVFHPFTLIIDAYSPNPFIRHPLNDKYMPTHHVSTLFDGNSLTNVTGDRYNGWDSDGLILAFRRPWTITRYKVTDAGPAHGLAETRLLCKSLSTDSQWVQVAGGLGFQRPVTFHPIVSLPNDYQTYMAPADGFLTFLLVGASGKDKVGAWGGRGGLSKGTLAVTKGQEFGIFVGGAGGAGGGFGTSNIDRAGGGLTAVFEIDKQNGKNGQDIILSDEILADSVKLARVKEMCVIVAGGGGGASDSAAGGGSGGGEMGHPVTNTECRYNFVLQDGSGSSGAFMDPTSGNRGGAGWNAGSQCGGGGTGGTGYIRSDLRKTVSFNGRGAQSNLLIEPQSNTPSNGDGKVVVSFHLSNFESKTCTAFQVHGPNDESDSNIGFGGGAGSQFCDVDNLIPLIFRKTDYDLSPEKMGGGVQGKDITGNVYYGNVADGCEQMCKSFGAKCHAYSKKGKLHNQHSAHEGDGCRLFRKKNSWDSDTSLCGSAVTDWVGFYHRSCDQWEDTEGSAEYIATVVGTGILFEEQFRTFDQKALQELSAATLHHRTYVKGHGIEWRYWVSNYCDSATAKTPAAAWMPPRSTVYGGNGGGLSITAGTNKSCDVIHIENVHMPGMITTVGAFTLTVSMSTRRDEGKYMSGTGFCRKGLCADDAATCVDGHAEIKSDLWTSYNDLKNSDSNHDSATDALKKAGNNPYQRTGDAVSGIYRTWAGAGYVNDLRQVTLANGDVITSTLCTDSSCNRAFDTRKSGDFNSEMLVYGAWSDCRTAAACNHRRLVYEIHGGQKVRVESFSLFMSNGAASMLRTGGCSTISVYYFDGAAFQPVSSAAMPCNLQTDPSVCGGNTICQTYTITMPVEGTTAIGFDFMPDTSRSEPNYALSEMTLQGREVVTRPTYTCNARLSSTLVNVNASNETHIWRSVDKSKVVGTTELYMQRNFDTGERTILTRINNGISSFIEGGVKLDFDEWGDPWDPAVENNAQLTFACEHDVCTVQINGSPATGTDVNGGRMIVGGKISLKQNGVNASVASYSIGTMQLLESLPGKGHSVVVKHLKVEEGVKLSNAVLVPAAVSLPRLLFQSDMTVFGDSETFEHDVCPSSNFKTMVYYPIDGATSEEEYQTYVAPADGTIHITAFGAAGWMNPNKNSRGGYGAQGGKGGLTKGTLPVIKGQTFVVFVGGYNKGFGGLNKKGGGLVAVFEKDTFPDNLATDRVKGKVACVIVAGSGGSGGSDSTTFEDRSGGNGGGVEGWPPRNSMPQGGNMGCQSTYGKQTSGGGWFKGGSRGGAGWQSGSDCNSNGGSAGGSGYVRDDMLDTIMMGGRGARRYTEDLQKFSGDGVISIAFRSEFESSDTCDEFEQVLGAPTSASGCDVAHLQQLNFREYLKQGSESGKSESLYICT